MNFLKNTDMKKYILSLLTTAILISGCADFLDEKPITTLTQDYYKSVEGLKSLTKGTYQILRFKSDYNQGQYLFGTCSDVEVFAWSLADRVAMGGYAPDGWNYDATGTRMTPQVNALIGQVSGNVSEGTYPVVNRCNIFFENYENLSDADKAKLKSEYGEMLFLRSYAYYLLSNHLGAIPIVSKSVSGMPKNFYYKKSTLEELFTLLIGDMKNAVDNYLPETSTELGRVTKPAGAHFLAKLYLNRAQATEFKESPEPTLKALYKGTDATDLDNAIKYSTVAIDLKKGATAYGGLEPNFANLWANIKSTSDPYARDKVSEVLLSAQYEYTQTYDGRYGNTLVHLYNSNHTDMDACTDRVNDYGRPYATAGASDWGYDMYDHFNDSRYYKTFLTDYVTTSSGKGKKWNELTAYVYNTYIKSSTDAAAKSGNYLFNSVGQRSIVYIENPKSEPYDSLWVASQPFLMNVRWIVGPPAGGYGKAGALNSGVEAGLINPIIKNKGTRKLYYRVDGNGKNYGIDYGTTNAAHYMGPRKWLDINRGTQTNANGNGAIDVTLMRLAETYLIRAEAYGRKGDFPSAINDLNVLRKRAAYHAGEAVNDVMVRYESGALSGSATPPANTAGSYKVTTDTYNKITITGDEWTPGTDKFKKENYPDNVTNYFVQFIYNERARELIFELTNWEDLHNAGILYERVVARDMMGAPASSTGTALYPFPLDDINNGKIGATGKGKGVFERKHTFKPWPKAYLDLLTDEDGNALTPAAVKEYQNYGY